MKWLFISTSILLSVITQKPKSSPAGVTYKLVGCHNETLAGTTVTVYKLHSDSTLTKVADKNGMVTFPWPKESIHRITVEVLGIAPGIFEGKKYPCKRGVCTLKVC